jgi:hypothetical protein
VFSPTMLTQLDSIGDCSGELRRAIEQKSDQKQWGCVCRLIWVAQRFPNKSLVPVLARFLDDRADDTCLEAIVDALVIMPDNRAAGPLTRALPIECPAMISRSTSTKKLSPLWLQSVATLVLLQLSKL